MEQLIENKKATAIYNKYNFLSGITVKTSSFEYENGVNEFHLIFSAKDHHGDVSEKIKHILLAFNVLRDEYFLGYELTPVFCRWFLSDAANQASLIEKDALECATSIIEQPPLDGSKVALWVYCINGVVTEKKGDNVYSIKRGPYTHIWQGDQTAGILDSEVATMKFLRKYADYLKDNDSSLLNNCIRTWFFVRDVDINYKGVVSGRNKVFEEQGLNSKNHFIASTGIGGKVASPSELVSFNAYSIRGISPDQIKYLKALTHLNPTIEYGVAFERGTAVDYGDRRHVFISGTASINNKGEIEHPGNIVKQTIRMWDNVEALLKEANVDWDNVGQLIVYLRDLSDYIVVAKMFEEKFPDIPTVITLAPVCRPGWLIEMECMASKPGECSSFASF